jgi:hypothetical protein
MLSQNSRRSDLSGVGFFCLVLAASATATTSAAVLGPSASSATTAASATAFTHRPGFVDHQGSTHEILTITRLNGAIGFLIVSKFRESETTWIAGELVANNLHRIGLKTRPREPILQFGFAGLVGKVAYK